MLIRGRGEVGEEEQRPPAPELVRQAHVPAPGAQPLGETGGQRRLDPGRDQLRLHQKATDLRRVADARDLLVDEFHEEAQEQPRADVVDRDLGVETVQQPDDRVQHGTRGARGRGLCDRVEEGVGVGGPVPDDRLHLGAEVPGLQSSHSLLTSRFLLLRRRAIELVQLGRELFGPVSICEPPLRESVSACPGTSTRTSSSSISFSMSSCLLSMAARARMLSQISPKAMVLLGGRREEGGENSIERGADATFLDSGRTRSTRVTTWDTSVVVGDDSPTRAPSEAGPTVSWAQLGGRPGPVSMSAVVGALWAVETLPTDTA
ncbi:unnamed protein product [Penicillium salamii]|nr:unnamed protein product [Penicillium salamii]